MTVPRNLAPDTERRLRERAAEAGQTPEVYLQRLTGRAMIATTEDAAPSGSQQSLALEEFDRLLDELSEGSARASS
jgi:hypothetical protein